MQEIALREFEIRSEGERLIWGEAALAALDDSALADVDVTTGSRVRWDDVDDPVAHALVYPSYCPDFETDEPGVPFGEALCGVAVGDVSQVPVNPTFSDVIAVPLFPPGGAMFDSDLMEQYREAEHSWAGHMRALYGEQAGVYMGP